jgi:tRNA (cytidine/uridine-2'-O-)-methyltransferase
MRLALYQPDIPQNTGALMRLAACLRVPLDIIEPCGFPFDEKRLRRTAMDYADRCEIVRHASWGAFVAFVRTGPGRRIVLLSTAATVSYVEHEFSASDVLLLGRESHGVPETVHASADQRLRVPMAGDVRSLNVVVAAAMVMGEALRQLGRFKGLNLL